MSAGKIIKGVVKEFIVDCEVRLSLQIPEEFLNNKGKCSYSSVTVKDDPTSFYFQFDSEECANSFVSELISRQSERIWKVFVDKFIFLYEEIPNQPMKVVYHVVISCVNSTYYNGSVITNQSLELETSSDRFMERKIVGFDVTYAEAQAIVHSFILEKSCQSDRTNDSKKQANFIDNQDSN